MKKAFKFAFICSIASVLGGIAGYAIGAFAWDELAGLFFQYIPGFTPEKFDKLKSWYEEWGWPLVFIAGFFPIPYKIFTVASGVLRNGFVAVYFGICCQPISSFFSRSILAGKIWGADERKN